MSRPTYTDPTDPSASKPDQVHLDGVQHNMNRSYRPEKVEKIDKHTVRHQRNLQKKQAKVEQRKAAQQHKEEKMARKQPVAVDATASVTKPLALAQALQPLATAPVVPATPVLPKPRNKKDDKFAKFKVVDDDCAFLR